MLPCGLSIDIDHVPVTVGAPATTGALATTNATAITASIVFISVLRAGPAAIAATPRDLFRA
jgi:hypothetical protein